MVFQIDSGNPFLSIQNTKPSRRAKNHRLQHDLQRQLSKLPAYHHAWQSLGMLIYVGFISLHGPGSEWAVGTGFPVISG